MKETINDRIERIYRSKRLKLIEFSKLTGISVSTINSAKGRDSSMKLPALEKILKAFPDINRKWLLDGTGPMLNTKNYSIETLQEKVAEETMFYSIMDMNEILSLYSTKIRLFPLQQLKDLPEKSSTKKTKKEKKQKDIPSYIPFINTQKDDKVIINPDHSMETLFHKESYLHIRKTETPVLSLEVGRIYLFETGEGQFILRKLQQDETPGSLKLVPFHPDFSAVSIPAEQIRSVWNILAQYTDFTKR